MNNSFTSPNNSISTSIGDSITAPISNIFSGDSTATNTGSDSGSGSGWGWSTWIVIILILAFLGFNIFIYLAKGTQVFANLSAKVASILGTGTAEVTKQVVNTAATGTKAAADVTAGTVNSTINYAENVASQIKQANNSQQQQLNNSLNQANKSYNGEDEEQQGYRADESSSSIQSSKSSGKSGWCYIGEDRGFRSCIKVGENDQCMSGDIYPSQQICMYPELRA
jgi:hypothetical protein